MTAAANPERATAVELDVAGVSTGAEDPTGFERAMDAVLTDDALCGAFRVWQRRRGHRYSLDDVVTAWTAARLGREAASAVDLGCGLGSVLLMLAWALPRARLVGVEALGVSFALAERNVARNGVGSRVRLLHGDLRDPAIQMAAGLGAFALVTGTPPYFPPGEATPSPDAQRAHARVELRGGIEAYLEAAGALVAPGGRVVMCAAAGADTRVRTGAARAGLIPVTRQAIVPREGRKGALFAVWTFKPATSQPETTLPETTLPETTPPETTPLETTPPATGLAPTPTELPPFVARDARGARTPEERALRRFFGLAARDDEAPSP